MTTSLLRTYRYLRLAIAAMVIVIFVAAALAVPEVGVLPSLSAYFYSPARTMFVGALIAASVCLFALSGHGAQRALLDAAALVLPLVAIVPAAILPGSVPGTEVACDVPCVPPEVVPGVDNGVATYLIVGGLAVVAAAVLIAAGQIGREGGMLSLAVAVTVLAIAAVTWALWHDAFLRLGHVVAATAFFALIAVIAVVNARDGSPAQHRLRVAYTAIAVAMLADLAALAVLALQGSDYGVLIGEVIALALFLVFWVLQSAQNWNETDPATLR